jgi:NADH:ubiquinone oxidoreductase subunit 4 (subunit M)
MTSLPFSPLEAALFVGLAGALWTSRVDGTTRARRRAMLSAALTAVLSAASWVELVRLGAAVPGRGFRLLSALGREGVLAVDGLDAPLLPLVSLLFLTTIAVTLSGKIRRFSFTRILVLEVLLLMTLCAQATWALIALVAAADLPLAADLRARGRSVRVFAVHAGASTVLLAAGAWVRPLGGGSPGASAAAWAMIAGGVAIRAGLVPAHCWVLDLFENASFGTALVGVSPLIGVYAGVRLLLPDAPGAVLAVLAYLALASALYNAAMSAVQGDARRFLCHVFLSHSSLVLAGVAFATPLGMTAGLVFWVSVPLSVTGLGLTLRSLEARTGRLSLREFHGLHVQTPTLAAFFLVLGLAAVGFPGTLGFFGAEMLIDAASGNRAAGVLVVLSAALSGIAVVRAYKMLFLGARHRSTVNLRVRGIELSALLILVALLVGGTLWPQPGIASRERAARTILELRAPPGADP